MTDQALIQQFLDGNIEAFNTLVWRWENPVYNFIFRYIGNRETARDICQNTFIKIYRELKGLREHDKFSSWVYRIAVNLCRDEFKKNKKKPVYYIDDMIEDCDATNTVRQIPDDLTPNPDEYCQNNQVTDILKKALQTLPEEQRIVIIMKQYQELKFTEIAEILKQPVNTIKSRLYYGLRALRKNLEASQYNKEVLFNEM